MSRNTLVASSDGFGLAVIDDWMKCSSDGWATAARKWIGGRS